MQHYYLKLEIWKRSRVLVKRIYLASQDFPESERFGLSSQLRRAAFSVPSNIAEGAGRGTPSQFQHFLNIAIGSLCELETQLYLASDLNYITNQKALDLISEVTQIRRMTLTFKKRLQ